LVHLEQAETT
jgi:hypothetical protein